MGWCAGARSGDKLRRVDSAVWRAREALQAARTDVLFMKVLHEWIELRWLYSQRRE